MSQRKLIRPRMAEVRAKRKKAAVKRPQSRKPTPPEQTFAEVYYYLKQMHAKTPMVVVLHDGETLRGWIEWYDKDFLKFNRHDEPNLLLSKQSIKYMFKDEEVQASMAEETPDTAETEAEEAIEEEVEEKPKPKRKRTTKTKK